MTHEVPADTMRPGASQPDLTSLVVPLLKGVLYREEDAAQWAALMQLQPRVRDYVAVLALDLVVDEAEGYAFLRSRQQADDGAPALPRLVRRQPLSFQVSLLLALLRKKLAEFDASGGDTRLILTRSAVVELVRVFLPAGSNESRLIDQIETQLNKVIELGFVRRLKAQADGAGGRSSQEPVYEVRRILKAFVDAQWLADFDQRLGEYQAQLAASATTESDDA
ncbi:MAG: DUF4194 domain-containing protein [Hydrogenophaga sp.]|uniref:DUF4194 domain-containing protein n=1 Tax=Hydrogenophaga sp. TaxID=1904254 RepID=UPI0027319D01|nr:DUF4194 domain-containing protein [Hydrogenophaga sp.]MDP2162932.1 DUF4194 domain-containing protein [Hydrogenophaga sp.]MDP3475888.1 DUF4194 domain-containing protein [Hydrogenophaga sp.]